jgi:hypothetical protein
MQIKHTFLFLFVAGLVWTGELSAHVLGPDPAVNGIFGTTCISCHSGNPLNAAGGSVTIDGLPTSTGWTPGQTYPLTITIQRPGQRLFGFQLSAVADASNQQAGTLALGSPRVKVICGRGTAATSTDEVPCTTAGAIQYAEHNNAQIATSTYAVNWTAPSSASVGTVRFNLAGNAANGDILQTGDFIYTRVDKVDPATGTPPPPPPPVTTFYFPQVADGVQDAVVSWKTTIFITNPAAVGSSPATGMIRLTTSSGAPFNVGFVDATGAAVGSGNTVPFTVAGGETRKFVSTGSGTLGVGFATVTADADVRGTALFSEFVNGSLFAEAGVPSANTVPRQVIFVDTTSGFNTGVAYANPNAMPATITLQLVSASGAPLGSAMTQTLAAGQHNAIFISQLFPGVAAFTGTMQIISDTPLSAVALRFASSAVFTTLPPVPLQ